MTGLNEVEKNYYIEFGKRVDMDDWVSLTKKQKALYIEIGSYDLLPEQIEDLRQTNPKLLERYKKTLENRLEIKINNHLIFTGSTNVFK